MSHQPLCSSRADLTAPRRQQRPNRFGDRLSLKTVSDPTTILPLTLADAGKALLTVIDWAIAIWRRRPHLYLFGWRSI